MPFINALLKVGIIFFVTIGLLFVSLDISEAKHTNQSHILEIVSFNVNKTTSKQKILQASNKVTQVLQKYDGFIKRTLTQNTDNPNQWVDIIEWQSIEDANNAMSKSINNKDIQNFLNLMKNGQKVYKTKSEYLNIQTQTI